MQTAYVYTINKSEYFSRDKKFVVSCLEENHKIFINDDKIDITASINLLLEWTTFFYYEYVCSPIFLVPMTIFHLKNTFHIVCTLV